MVINMGKFRRNIWLFNQIFKNCFPSLVRLGILLLIFSSAVAQEHPRPDKLLMPPGKGLQVEEGQVIITFKDAPDERVFTDNGGNAHHKYKIVNAIAGKVPRDKIDKIKKHPNVLRVEDDAIVENLAQPIPWGVSKVRADWAWTTSTGAGVKVAVIDTGIDDTHPDFKDAYGVSRVFLGPTFVPGTTTSKDDHYHGTHV